MQKRSDQMGRRRLRVRVFCYATMVCVVTNLVAISATQIHAQTFVGYSCDDGTAVSAAFFKGEPMRMQVDGKALTLPQRLSGSGARYAKAGVSFWVKGQEARLKRPKRKATSCKAQ